MLRKLLSLLLLLALAACAEPGPTATETPVPPATASPTTAPAASATAPPSATPEPAPVEAAAIPTAGPTLTPAPVPENFTTYHAPYWVTFHYPESWQQVRGGSVGLALSTDPIEGQLYVPPGGALFFVGERFYESQSPVAALGQEFAGTLDREQEPIIRPLHPFAVNGQEAASLGYRFAGPSGEPLLATVTFVAGPGGRMVSLLALAAEEQESVYAPLFRQITQSLVVQPPAPAPAIGAAAPPPGMTPYRNPPARVRVELPADWSVDAQPVQLRLLPPGVDAAERVPDNIIVVIPPDQFQGNPEDALANLLDQTMLDAFRPGVMDAIPVSPVSTAEVDGQEMARGLYSGTVNGRPVLDLIAVVRAGPDVLQAVSLISDPAQFEELFAAILDTLRVEQRTATLPQSRNPLARPRTSCCYFRAACKISSASSSSGPKR